MGLEGGTQRAGSLRPGSQRGRWSLVILDLAWATHAEAGEAEAGCKCNTLDAVISHVSKHDLEA